MLVTISRDDNCAITKRENSLSKGIKKKKKEKRKKKKEKKKLHVTNLIVPLDND
ncbi:hypothetical protein ACMBCN_01105 [Candidatus Liberibacter asiaticus]|nr:hypothetical protein [Candidatus Liberibacter asiaticus]